MQWAFITNLLCITMYVITSLLTCRKSFNMNRLLHRGSYSVEGEHRATHTRPSLIWRILGVDKEYSLKDKLIATAVAGYTIMWIVFLIIGTGLNRIIDISDQAWGRFWHIMVLGLTTAAVITAQIASSFMDQAQSRRNADSGPDDDSTDGRIRRIEEMLNDHFGQTDSSKDQT